MSTSSLFPAVAGTAALASVVNQFQHGLTGIQDLGIVTLFQPIGNAGALTAAINTTSGNLTGIYSYVVTFVTGGTTGTGTFYVANETAAGAESNVVAPSAEQVMLSAIPIGPTGTIWRNIYRITATGTTYYLLTSIQDNTTTTWTDNVTDADLGTKIAPTINTTGTLLQFPVYPNIPEFSGVAGTIAGIVTGSATMPIWWNGTSWGSFPLLGTASIWTAAQTFSDGITGTGTTGNLTAGTGILETANTWTAAQTFSDGITGSGTTGNLTAGTGILNTANTWGAAQTVNGGLLGMTYDFGNVAGWGSNADSGTVSNVGTNPAGFFAGWNGTNQDGEVDLIAFSPTSATYSGQFAFWANPTKGSTTIHRVFTINANASVLTANNTLDNGSGASTTVGLATFNTGITGAGTTGALTAGTGILETANTFTEFQTFSDGITGSGTMGTLTAGTGILETANTFTEAQTLNAGEVIPAGESIIFGSTTAGISLTWDSSLGGLVYAALS